MRRAGSRYVQHIRERSATHVRQGRGTMLIRAIVLMLAMLALHTVPARADWQSAGPIWNDMDAQRKCPSTCGREGWDGNWKTVEMGRNSVCFCKGRGQGRAELERARAPQANRRCRSDLERWRRQVEVSARLRQRQVGRQLAPHRRRALRLRLHHALASHLHPEWRTDRARWRHGTQIHAPAFRRPRRRPCRHGRRLPRRGRDGPAGRQPPAGAGRCAVRHRRRADDGEPLLRPCAGLAARRQWPPAGALLPRHQWRGPRDLAAGAGFPGLPL